MKKNAFLCFFTILLSQFFNAQPYDPQLLQSMKWRMIGPFRGGRTVGACGIPKQPNVFYTGVNNGGVWKTTDYGRTWHPLFDSQSTGSIGDVVVSPSNPSVIYAGSGEGIQRPDLSVGNGIYKSADGGKTWINTGLNDGLQIGGLSIDPSNENRLFAAVLGHPYGPNTERGIFRTLDGGKTWEKVLYLDENTGAIQVTLDPSNPQTVYADLYAARQAPWENGQWEGPGSGLYKSTDGGTTWKKLEKGLPSHKDALGRIGFAIAPSDSKRLYALVSANEASGGFYRSDDAGESWTKLSSDIRFWDRGDDFAELKVDPKNADIVYNANVVVWKSLDGGKTWKDFRGAPGGDDYHRLWINPENTNIILLTSDQGAIITVNGGETWSSWLNQPTAQFYHVSADNAFPYNVYSGQQESGSVGIASRGNDGAVTAHDWHPVGAEEYGYVVADPLDPDIIYGGKLSRFDKRTGQVQDISPDATHSGAFRFLRTAPIVFSPIDNKTLFFAGNKVFRTRNGGQSWDIISPDLTRATYSIPENIGVYKQDSMRSMKRRGVVYTLALSALDSNILWAGTDDGLIQLTKDGGRNWSNVTPPEINDWSKISMLDASHSDVNTAYAAVNRIKLDDYRPHIYRTHDSGKTWKEIVNGLPNDPINVVKEDPIRKGLLFAGSETAVYVSFDEGDHWQSLRLNMPASSVRDLVVKDNDLVVATHGRSFWILDDITPLRQLNAELLKQKTVLYKPAPAYRVRWNMYTDTPSPQEEPAGQNPPDGAILYYNLKEKATGEMKLEIKDSTGKLIWHYSLPEIPDTIIPLNIPTYWVRPFQTLSPEAGAHLYVWNLHEQPINVSPAYPIAAVYGQTAPESTSPWIMPGTYRVSLTVNGQVSSQTLLVKMDPRVHTTRKTLQEQYMLSAQCTKEQRQILKIRHAIRQQLKTLDKDIPKASVKLRSNLETHKDLLLQLSGSSKPSTSLTFLSLKDTEKALFDALQGADAQPTDAVRADVQKVHESYIKLMSKWKELEELEKGWNSDLKKEGLELLNRD
ncbi:MAG: WD40/YVTN/BNR-like repeat-containing protein [Bacteroidia bacterium]